MAHVAISHQYHILLFFISPQTLKDQEMDRAKHSFSKIVYPVAVYLVTATQKKSYIFNSS